MAVPDIWLSNRQSKLFPQNIALRWCSGSYMLLPVSIREGGVKCTLFLPSLFIKGYGRSRELFLSKLVHRHQDSKTPATAIADFRLFTRITPHQSLPLKAQKNTFSGCDATSPYAPFFTLFLRPLFWHWFERITFRYQSTFQIHDFLDVNAANSGSLLCEF
jgi:hypothetical protein